MHDVCMLDEASKGVLETSKAGVPPNVGDLLSLMAAAASVPA